MGAGSSRHAVAGATAVRPTCARRNGRCIPLKSRTRLQVQGITSTPRRADICERLSCRTRMADSFINAQIAVCSSMIEPHVSHVACVVATLGAVPDVQPCLCDVRDECLD